MHCLQALNEGTSKKFTESNIHLSTKLFEDDNKYSYV